MKKARKEIVYYLCAALLVAGAVSVSYMAGMFSGVESFLEDRLQTVQPVRDDIVVVAIDDASLANVGQWPWSRMEHARLLRAIDKERPTVIAVDVVFADASMRGPADDAVLRKTLTEMSSPVVLAAEGRDLSFANETPTARDVVLPRPDFVVGRASIGEVNVIVDSDAVARRVPLVVTHRDTTYRSLGFDALQRAGVSLSSWPVVSRIKYSANAGGVPTISAADILNSSPHISLAGKYVFVGVTAPDLHDALATPLSHGSLVPGVEIQAQIARMLLEGAQGGFLLASLSLWQHLLIFFLNALILLGVFVVMRSIRWPLVAVGVLSFSWLVASIELFDRGMVVNIVHTILSVLVTGAALFVVRYVRVEAARRDMRHAFSKYVSRDVLEEILKDPRAIQLGGEERNATIMFSDVRGFTTLSEAMTATGLVSFLNRYLSRMTDIILEHRGVVDKYIGDAIMAFWGAPIKTETHALEAIRATLAMTNSLRAFNEDSRARGEREIDIGVGLNSGDVVAGNMGSNQRFDYTVMGDTVNLASRLEGQTKTYGIRILASEYTIYSAGGVETLAEENIVAREIDRIAVKGKKLPVRVFEIVEPDLAAARRSSIVQFNALREMYYEGLWDDAVVHGDKYCRENLDDVPAKVIVERCTHFASEPPVEWSGVYTLKTK